MAMEKKRDSFL